MVTKPRDALGNEAEHGHTPAQLQSRWCTYDFYRRKPARKIYSRQRNVILGDDTG